MLRVLHIEGPSEPDSPMHRALAAMGVEATLTPVRNRSEFLAALDRGEFDLLIADRSLPDLAEVEALETARRKFPSLGFLRVPAARDELWQVAAAFRREEERQRLLQQHRGMSRLVSTVQELSLARDLNATMAIVRRAARELTGADGATFVLRDGDKCYYADEDAIAPLWKGQRFPMPTCISGWVMLHGQPALIEDIYADPRIPAVAYRPTFVKSLAMVPIRTESPIGAIGNYWARRHLPTEEEVGLLQALANTTAVAMENVRVYEELEQRVKDRTLQLESANHELESFSHAVSHDLGAPLRSISGFTQLAIKECNGALTEKGRRYLDTVHDSAGHMRELMDDLLRLSRVSRGELRWQKVNLTQLAREIIGDLALTAPDRRVEVRIAEGLEAEGDAGLLRIVLQNLLSNAWKYTAKRDQARIDFETAAAPDGGPAYRIRDNGAGFDMEYADKLFKPFQRLHRQDEFPGNGIGLTTVQRIVQRHGGKIWAESETGKGASFYFTLKGRNGGSALI